MIRKSGSRNGRAGELRLAGPGSSGVVLDPVVPLEGRLGLVSLGQGHLRPRRCFSFALPALSTSSFVNDVQRESGRLSSVGERGRGRGGDEEDLRRHHREFVIEGVAQGPRRCAYPPGTLLSITSVSHDLELGADQLSRKSSDAAAARFAPLASPAARRPLSSVLVRADEGRVCARYGGTVTTEIQLFLDLGPRLRSLFRFCTSTITLLHTRAKYCCP